MTTKKTHKPIRLERRHNVKSFWSINPGSVKKMLRYHRNKLEPAKIAELLNREYSDPASGLHCTRRSVAAKLARLGYGPTKKKFAAKALTESSIRAIFMASRDGFRFEDVKLKKP